MSKQEIQISSVKLLQGGLKGLQINYLRINDVNSNLYKAEIKETNHRPVVGTDILTKFDEFAKYLTDLCSIEEGKVTATGITAGFDKFLISGTIEVLDGAKKSAINTPCIKSDDEYESFDAVQVLVDDLYKMVLEYMEKEAYTATSENVILNLNKGKEGFDAEAVKNMSLEEQVSEATKLLEKIGCVVMNPHEEDMPGGIDASEMELKDISAGDEKETLFEDDDLEDDKDMPPAEVIEKMSTTEIKTVVNKAMEEVVEEKIEEIKVEVKPEPKVIDIEQQQIAAKEKIKKLEELKKATAALEKDIDVDFVLPSKKAM